MRDDARQLQVLAAIGIDVYRLRSMPAGAAACADAASAAPALVVACAKGDRSRADSARWLSQILRALGATDETTTWVETAPGAALPAVPDAPAYLMIGSDVARACSAQMPLQRQDRATIAILADIGDLGGGATQRRALWQALKPLARRLRAAAD
jgi:hypothetical protein